MGRLRRSCRIGVWLRRLQESLWGRSVGAPNRLLRPFLKTAPYREGVTSGSLRQLLLAARLLEALAQQRCTWKTPNPAVFDNWTHFPAVSNWLFLVSWKRHFLHQISPNVEKFSSLFLYVSPSSLPIHGAKSGNEPSGTCALNKMCQPGSGGLSDRPLARGLQVVSMSGTGRLATFGRDEGCRLLIVLVFHPHFLCPLHLIYSCIFPSIGEWNATGSLEEKVKISFV